MSKNYVIFSDSGCDLPEEVINQYNIGLVNFSFKIDEDSYNEKTAASTGLYIEKGYTLMQKFLNK